MPAVVLSVFGLLFVLIIIGVYGEQRVVMGSLSRATGSSVPLASTQKKRFENLEAYRQICISQGKALGWYHYLNFAYQRGFAIALGFIAFALMSLGLG